MALWQETVLLIVVALGASLLLKAFVVDAYAIPSGSMEQTLQVGDRILVNKVIYRFRAPARGEVIVFRGTGSWQGEGGTSAPAGPFGAAVGFVASLFTGTQPGERDLTKRVIGVAGDTVQCCDSGGRVTVNGRPLTEPYVFQNTPIEQRPFGPVKVPTGRLFVLGDHRSVSADSRFHLADQWRGTVPVDQVLGQAFAVAWPPPHWHWLPVPEGFTTLSALAVVGTSVRRRRSLARPGEPTYP